MNGASGIAVGMATNIPPHNLGEVIDGLIELMDNPDIDIRGLMKYIKGPDFPTGSIIQGREGIRKRTAQGGRIRVRGKTQIEQLSNGKTRILITELPYQVNKARLIEKIAELVRDKRVDGITDLRDESDKTGMRIVIELRRDAFSPMWCSNRLYKHSQLEDTFGVIMLALVDNEPKVMNLKEVLNHYLDHQKEVVLRRTCFELRKAEERAHILEGYRIALNNIDEIIAIIRAAYDDAKERLMDRFGLFRTPGRGYPGHAAAGSAGWSGKRLTRVCRG